MTRPAALVALALLAGCPLPQALPDTVAAGASGFGPRIPFELVSPQATVIEVRKDCGAAPAFRLRATLTDRDQLERVEARWFADYQVPGNVGILRSDFPDGNGQDFLRPVPELVYSLPDGSGPVFGTHVVELVVSNGFKTLDLASDPLPNRMPVPDRDTQTFRWVFRYVDAGGSCGP